MTPLRRPFLRLLNALRPGRGEDACSARSRPTSRSWTSIAPAASATRRPASPRAAPSAASSRRRSGSGEARSFSWLDDARRDAAYAVRTLRRAPAFAVAVVLTLALGIGATTAMFTVLDGVVLKPLRYPTADRIVTVQTRWTDTGQTTNLAGGDEMDVRGLRGSFEAFAHYYGGEMGIQLGDHAEFVGTQLVHADFFRVFGVSPSAGRLLQPSDAERAAVVEPRVRAPELRHAGRGPRTDRLPRERRVRDRGRGPGGHAVSAEDRRLARGRARSAEPEPHGPQLPDRGSPPRGCDRRRRERGPLDPRRPAGPGVPGQPRGRASSRPPCATRW